MKYWNFWVSILDRRENAHSLALVRIACGLIVCIHLSKLLYSGTTDWVWVDATRGGLRSLDPAWMSYFGGLTPNNVHVLVGIVAVAAFCMSLGLATRLSTLITWFGYDYLADLNNHSGGSYDELIKNTLFLLLLSGAGKALSVDARLRPSSALVPAWPRYLMVVQLVLVYWMTALQKVSSSWVPMGELDALWYILQQPTWQRIIVPMGKLTAFYPLTQLATLSVWLFEQAAPLLLLSFWYRDTRSRPGWLRHAFNAHRFRDLFLFYGLTMHLGIEILMEVGPFSWATLTLYLACFHPDEWRAFWGRKPAS